MAVGASRRSNTNTSARANAAANANDEDIDYDDDSTEALLRFVRRPAADADADIDLDSGSEAGSDGDGEGGRKHSASANAALSAAVAATSANNAAASKSAENGASLANSNGTDADSEDDEEFFDPMSPTSPLPTLPAASVSAAASASSEAVTAANNAAAAASTAAAAAVVASASASASSAPTVALIATDTPCFPRALPRGRAALLPVIPIPANNNNSGSVTARTNSSAVSLTGGVAALCAFPSRPLWVPALPPPRPVTAFSLAERDVAALTAIAAADAAATSPQQQQPQSRLTQSLGPIGADEAELLRDMSAFKAANPGCVFADFLRWCSPQDLLVPAAGLPTLSAPAHSHPAATGSGAYGHSLADALACRCGAFTSTSPSSQSSVSGSQSPADSAGATAWCAACLGVYDEGLSMEGGDRALASVLAAAPSAGPWQALAALNAPTMPPQFAATAAAAEEDVRRYINICQHIMLEVDIIYCGMFVFSDSTFFLLLTHADLFTFVSCSHWRTS